MLVTKRLLIVVICIFTVELYSQQSLVKLTRFSYSAGLSAGKLPSGVGEGDPIGQTWSDPHQFSNHLSISRLYERKFIHASSFSLEQYFYRDEVDYQIPPSSPSYYLSGRRMLLFMGVGYSFGRSFKIRKASIIPEAGFNVYYLLKASRTTTTNQGSATGNYTSNISRFNYGVSLSIKGKIQVNDKIAIAIGPVYKHLFKVYRFPGDRVLYFYGISLDVIRSK